MSLVVLSGAILFVTIINMGMLKKTDTRLSGHILNTSFLFYFVCLCYKTGGFFSISMIMLFFVPLFILVFPDKKLRWGYVTLAFFLFFSFYFEQRMNLGVFVAQRIVNISLYRLYNLLTILGCFFGLVMVYANTNDQIRRLLDHARADCRQISEKSDQAMKIKDEFLANMSHEIRNPMNGIIGMMHVLLDSDLDEEQKKYSRIVYNSSRELLTIVNDILDLSKINAGKLELDIRDFDLEIAIKDIVSFPELQARQKGIDFSYSIDPDIPCRLQGDIARIRQVINNLAGNAIKFTDSGEVVLSITLISETENSAELHFKVEDTGIGIKKDQLDVLFESFTQANLSITKKYGGTGLGLAISKLLVEKMQGKIGAQSIDMVGSTFWFTLVLKKQSEKETPVDLFSQKIEDCKILVFTDGLSPGINFDSHLTALKIEYEQTFDSTEAMEMLKWGRDDNTPFQIVIMEARENDMAAEILGKKIKQDEQFNHIKLILLTSIGKKGDARRFEEIGFSAYLSTPVKKSLLLNCIKRILAQSQGKDGGNLSIITRYSIVEDKKYLRKILIVEDMETNLLMAKALIGRLGYKTDEAKNGVEAVLKHKKNLYDLILMDCQMPQMDGFEATRQIRENEKKYKMEATPIIAMTGNAFESDREKCFKAGMDDFIAKPVEPDILSQKIRSNLKGQLLSSETLETGKSEHGSESADIKKKTVPLDKAGLRGEKDICFNRDKLFERFGGDEALIEVVLDAFFQEAPALIEKIGQAIDEKDYDRLRSNSHALKGSAANVNADLLRNAAKEMETAANQESDTLSGSRFGILQQEFNRFFREAKS